MGPSDGAVGGVGAAVGGWTGGVVVRRAAAGGGPRAAGRAGGAGPAAGRSSAIGTDRAGLGTRRPWARSAHDPDGQLRAADGRQAAHRLGDQTLVREVSDSRHLRRFCLLPLTQRAPEESTVRKLVRRLGPETVAELTRVVIGKAQRETRLWPARCGSTRPWSRLTSAIPQMGCWPGRARGCWLARAASWPVGCVARPCGWSTAPGRSASWCARSPGRWRGALASAQARSWRSMPRRGGRWPARSVRREHWPRRPAQPRVGVGPNQAGCRPAA
jgi:hypothetical protein